MHRSITRPFFVKDRVRDFETFDKYAMKTIETMKQRFNEGYALDLEVGCIRSYFPKDLTKQWGCRMWSAVSPSTPLASSFSI